MGSGMVILFWLFLAGIYGCFFLVFVGLWFWGRKKNITWLKWLGGIPASIMLLIAVLLTALIAYGIHQTKNPEYVFKEAFGVEKPNSVSNIQSSYYQFADTGITYIRRRIYKSCINSSTSENC
jgi:phosphotransferase system  glucose/maltose/N-acetylglucosamine-specific IIC component